MVENYQYQGRAARVTRRRRHFRRTSSDADAGDGGATDGEPGSEPTDWVDRGGERSHGPACAAPAWLRLPPPALRRARRAAAAAASAARVAGPGRRPAPARSRRRPRRARAASPRRRAPAAGCSRRTAPAATAPRARATSARRSPPPASPASSRRWSSRAASTCRRSATRSATRRIHAVAEYVAAELADPAARRRRPPTGGDLYRLYCAGCHSATGRGGALTAAATPPTSRSTRRPRRSPP